MSCAKYLLPFHQLPFSVVVFLWFLLLCRSFLFWWGPISSFLLLFPLPLERCWVRSCCSRGQRGFHLLSPWGFWWLPVLHLFWSFIYFDFIFMYGVRKWSRLIFLHVTLQFSQHHLVKGVSLFHWISLLLWPRLVGHKIGSTSEVCILFHRSMLSFCANIIQSWWLQLCNALEARDCDAFSFGFLFQYSLDIWGLFWFHTNFRIVSCSSMKNTGAILIGIALNYRLLWVLLTFLTIFVLPIQEHGIFFHICVCVFFNFSHKLPTVFSV